MSLVSADRLTPAAVARAALPTVVVLLGLAYVVSLIPGVRPAPGFDTGLDVWLYDAFCTGVIALVAIRAARDRRERWAFAALAVGLASYLAGDLLYQLVYLPSGEIPFPSWADAAWLLLYPATYVAVVLMLRRRVRRLPASVWLDGAVAGLTAAAFGTALAFRSLLASTEGGVGVVATNVAYPVADLLLLALVLGAVTVVGVRGAGAAWWWLALGILIFAVTDTVYAVQVAEGTYVDAGPLDACWVLAWLAFAGAACTRPGTGVSTRLEGVGVLVLPGLCATASLALLYAGYASGDADPLAGALALAALVAALLRTALTFREVRALAENRRLALTDDLTGLPNRRQAYQVLEGADAALAAGRSFAVLLLDLDRFKEINDSLGHAVGDMLLRDLAPRLRERLRPGDVLARLGGDEFVVLAADTDVAVARQVAESLRDELRHPFRMGPTSLTVDASVGIAVGPDHATTARDLLQRADMAMYAAKSRRAGVTVYDEERDGRTRTSWETVEQLRSGLPRGELELQYQPKLALHGRGSPAVEALARWRHPSRGLLQPDAFVPLAESHGLMPQLTTTVLDLALEQRRAWEVAGLDLTMAVNVSPSNLVDEGFPRQVTRLLAHHRVPASALVLEVTENLLMEDRERSAAILAQLRQAGVGVAIDDYGTGYSSLSYLAQLPVTELKLDRSFVAAVTDDARGRAIVTSAVQLAHALGLVLVAEGVEDEETMESLRRIGCDFVQGYHLSRPLPAAAVLDWFERRGGATVVAPAPSPAAGVAVMPPRPRGAGAAPGTSR
ncbi:MAG: putative bifunctional diguanylate cyclase/phosphodiesterase [Kineosporiaceae bacterium]